MDDTSRGWGLLLGHQRGPHLATSGDFATAMDNTRWGLTSHRIQMMVCQRCSYILHFYRHHSIFNFD